MTFSILEIFIVGILIYLFFGILWKWMIELLNRQNGYIMEWIPKKYWKHFNKYTRKENLIDKGEEIPSDTPTLFIIGSFQTQSGFVRFLDSLLNIITFGFIRIKTLFPVNVSLDLKLYFKNISKNNFVINGGQTRFFIKYPNELLPTGHLLPSRHWNFEIPCLKEVGESCFLYSKNFFTPEISGEHELLIESIENIRLVGPFGIANRPYRVPAQGGMWRLTFHVSNKHEYQIFLISFITLAVAMLSLLLVMAGLIFDIGCNK